MTDRRRVLSRALVASLTGDRAAIVEAFTPDVVGRAPNLWVHSVDELSAALADRSAGLAHPAVSYRSLDQLGQRVVAEWTMAVEHVGPVRFGPDDVYEGPGPVIELEGATFAEFRGDRICAFRHYFDGLSFRRQLAGGDPPTE